MIGFMEQSRFDVVTRLMAGLGSRRTALSVAAASGLALTGQSAAAKGEVGADGKKRGKRGRRGHSGPLAGANAQVVSETCLLPAVGEEPEIGDVAQCVATCPDGFVAVGGGYEGPKFIDALGIVLASFPDQEAGESVGWVTQVEFLDVGQEFNVTTYAICLPA